MYITFRGYDNINVEKNNKGEYYARTREPLLNDLLNEFCLEELRKAVIEQLFIIDESGDGNE